MVPGIAQCSPLASLSHLTYTRSVEHTGQTVPLTAGSSLDHTSAAPDREERGTGASPPYPRNRTSILAQQLPQPRNEAERLGMLALPDVAAEDDAERAGLHGLAGLFEDALVAGLLAAGEQHRGAGGGGHDRVDRLLLG